MLNVPQYIKDLLHMDTCKKNIRITFPNGERSDICNNLIVLNTVSFKESLCSQETLKFGLCEAPVFECEVVGVGNIKGAKIVVFCEIYCNSNTYGAVFREDLQAYVYPITYGTFIVESCKRQGNIIHRKIIAYGNLLHAVNEINNIERLKEKYSYGETQDTYTPTALYYALTNLNLTSYDNNIFNEENLQGGQTGTAFVDSWFYEHRELSLRLRNSISRWNISAADTDALYYYIIDYSGIKAARELITEKLNQYEYPFTESIARFSECFMRIHWSGAFTGGGQISNEDIEEENPGIITRIFYPYIMGASAEIECGRPGVNTLTIEDYNTSEVLEQIDLGNLVKSVQLIKLTAKNEYSGIAAIKLSIQEKKAANNYYRLDLKAENNNADVLNSLMEFMGLFGRINRFNAFEALNIKRKFLITPSNTLYPEGTLYPGQPTGGSILPKDYQTCWYDDEYLKPFGAISCLFKNTSNVEILYVIYLPGYDSQTDPNLYQVYDLSNNYFIKTFLWSEQQIQTFCQNIINNIEGVTYMPVDFKGRGLPYVEAGDTFEILTRSGDSITTIVLNKTTTGEQTLTDNYKSTGTGTVTI